MRFFVPLIVLYECAISLIPLGNYQSIVAAQDLLILRGKRLHTFNATANQTFSSLKYLDLSDNFLVQLTKATFHNMNSLEKLYLRNNSIQRISHDAFESLRFLKVLDLSRNKLDHISETTFRHLKSIQKLYLDENCLERISSKAFINLSSLKILHASNNRLHKIIPGTFDSVASLSTLYLDHNKLVDVPECKGISTVALLSMASNPVKKLKYRILKHYTHLEQLYLSYTDIEYLGDDVFRNNRNLHELHLAGASLLWIGPNAFRGPKLHKLYEWNLKGSKITSLPVNGLQWLTNLNIKNVHNLWHIPASSLSRLGQVHVTYSFHCCLLHNARVKTSIESFNGNYTTCPPRYANLTSTTHQSTTERTSTFSTPSPKNVAPLSVLDYFASRFGKWLAAKRRAKHKNGSTETTQQTSTILSHHMTAARSLLFTLPPHEKCPETEKEIEIFYVSPENHFKCVPSPDAFNPCENLMGEDGLRISVWFVFTLAILGNLLKLLVHLTSRKESMLKLLMCSLAFANLCTGIYLAILAIEDLLTRGEYQNHIMTWQYGAGCEAAGFLCVFSNELSTFTLTIITFERYYKIVFPLHILKHLVFKDIAIMMLIGWALSLAVASLPLFGISSYSKVAVCLPFDVTDFWSKAYVTFLLAKNMLSFLIMFYCYGKMYSSLSGHPCVGSIREDRPVVTRMAILVFTNCACLFPISLLGLIAIYDKSLIAVDTSKFLLVFILPINSFTNPYLYAINTQTFRLGVIEMLARCGIRSKKPKKLVQTKYKGPKIVSNYTENIPMSSFRNATVNSISFDSESQQQQQQMSSDYRDAKRISVYNNFVRGTTAYLSESFGEERYRQYLKGIKKNESFDKKRSKSCTDIKKNKSKAIQKLFYKGSSDNKNVSRVGTAWHCKSFLRTSAVNVHPLTNV